MSEGELLAELGAHPRVVLVGGPRTGKSIIAARASERCGRPVRWADALIGELEWSEASALVSQWLDEPGEWIVEGIATVRALRKWLERNPGKPLDATIVHLGAALHQVSKGQLASSAGVATVWHAILPELQARRTTILHRD